MPQSLIEYRERPRGPIETWAYQDGSRADIDLSAALLLVDLLDEGLRAPAVYVDGQRITKARAASLVAQRPPARPQAGPRRIGCDPTNSP